jgi:hypothetical protein
MVIHHKISLTLNINANHPIRLENKCCCLVAGYAV